MKVLLSQRAEDDLARIYGCIAARNPDAAERFKIEAQRALAKSPPKPPDLGYLFEKNIHVDYYLGILTDLAKIIFYKEVEVFDYTAERDRTIVRVSHSDDRLKMSARWGYIYSEEQPACAGRTAWKGVSS